jgi:hypothetical protein
MKHLRASFSWISMVPVILGLVVVLSALMPAQDVNKQHIVKDWSTHHLVFSKAGTKNEAIERGTYDRWLKIVNDPRYIMQQEERSAAPQAAVTLPAARAEDSPRTEVREGPEAQQDREAGVGIAPARAEEDAGQLPGGRLRGLVKALIPPPVQLSGAKSDLTSASPDATKKKKPPKNRLKKDWSEDMQSTTGTAGAIGATTGMGQFPATYSTSTTTPNCSDFAIFNTGLAGTSTQPNVIAYNNLYSSCSSSPSTYFAYNTTASGNGATPVLTSIALSFDGTQFAFVQNVPNPTAASGTATAGTSVPTSGDSVVVGGTTYTWTSSSTPATANLMSTSGLTLVYEIAQTFYAALTGNTANCPPNNASHCIGTGTTANSSVNATYPAESTTVTATASCGVGTCGNTVVWKANQSAAELTFSPNGDLGGGAGTAGVGGGTLVLVRIGAGGTLTAPTAPTAVSPSSYSSCTAPCMTAIQLSGSLISSTLGPTDTYSSPFYDYPTNTLWVGDDSGGLHQITNVFSNSSSPATPTETTSSGWPVAVNLSASLGGPVFDPVSTNVFVGDYALSANSICFPESGPSTIPCGYLYAVTPAGAVTQSAELDYNFGIADAPLLDPTVGEVFAFVGADNSTACANSGPCAGVYQLPTTFGADSSGTEAQVGAGYEFLLSGAFDNAYLTTGTGNLYVVGNTGPANNTLYQIPITSDVMGTSANTGPVVATNYTNGFYSAGQQVTEFYNTSAGGDNIFLSVLAFGSPTTGFCGTTLSEAIGCIEGFNVTSGIINGSTTPTGALPEEGGTSGIVIDNGVAGASNIYFSTLLDQTGCTGGTGGCAVQTTQLAP